MDKLTQLLNNTLDRPLKKINNLRSSYMDNNDEIKEITSKINKTRNEGIDLVIELAFDRGRLTSDSPSIAKKEILALAEKFKHKGEF